MFSLGKNARDSFTLIELLVVLALVAILSVVIVMTLNPAELIKQARDSNRLSDLATINTALNLFSTDVTSGFVGTSTIIYVSIPSTQQNCSNLGLPLLATSSYTYNCVTQANLRNTDGTGWIPVNLQRISSNSPISQLPVDPINTTTTLNYYTYMSGGSWKLSAVSLESQKYITEGNKDGGIASASYEIGNNLTLGQTIFPNGWIKVPGDSRFGTSDFWVMKYEAKCADASGNLLTSPDGGNQTYPNSTNPCNSANNKYIASAPTGYSLTKIAQGSTGTDNDAIEYCQSIGSHLITNNEWQTVAWNVQNNAINWTGGSIGSGQLYSGHNDNVPAYAVQASIDDADGYINTSDSSGTQKRTLILSNGQTIWDLSGNVWEWTNDTIVGTSKPIGASGAWAQWSAVSDFGGMTQATAGPVDPTWNNVQRIGQYYQGTLDAVIYGFIRGGSWSNTSISGVEAMFMNYAPSYSTSQAFGFRCAR